MFAMPGSFLTWTGPYAIRSGLGESPVASPLEQSGVEKAMLGACRLTSAH